MFATADPGDPFLGGGIMPCMDSAIHPGQRHPTFITTAAMPAARLARISFEYAEAVKDRPFCPPLTVFNQGCCAYPSTDAR